MDCPRGSQGSEGEDRGRHTVQHRSNDEQDTVHKEVFNGRDLGSIVAVVLSGPETCAVVNIGINERTAETYPSTTFGRQVRLLSAPS